MSGDNTAEPIVWGVAVESGRVHAVEVVPAELGWTVPGWPSHDGTDDAVTARTQREIVLRWATTYHRWLVVELIAPGDVSRATLAYDNATLRAELDDLRGRLSRTANRLADLERTSAALTHDAALAALRRGPVVSRCGACHEERARWCAGCGFCEATCCACPGDEGSAA